MSYSHKELVEIAYGWALKRHNIVLKEKASIYEIPDVFGFSYSYTTLIEVKSNRADFLRDKKKSPRYFNDIAIGNYRLYCTPKGLLTEDDIPDTWQLLEVYPSGFAKLKTNIYMHRNGAIWWHTLTVDGHRAEKRLLFNAYLDKKL